MNEWLQKMITQIEEKSLFEWASRVSSDGDEGPRTLAAELENKHLNRPLIFEPALKQYSAFRAGEPVFENEADASRWFTLRSSVLQHILLQISKSTASKHLILRGSALMSLWFAETARRPGDLDWVVTPDSWRYNSEQAIDLFKVIQGCLNGTSDNNCTFLIPDRDFVSEEIWTYEKAPGKRLIIPWNCEDQTQNGTIQMDLVFGEVMPSEPIIVSIETSSGEAINITSASPEQSLAWKLLWLATDMYGQGKDLYDAVLLAEQFSLDINLLRETFILGDSDRQYDPFDDFNENGIKNWNIEWDDFKKEYPTISGTEQDWKQRLVKALGPLLAK